MDRRRASEQEMRLVLTAVLLLLMFVYQAVVDHQELPSSVDTDIDIKEQFDDAINTSLPNEKSVNTVHTPFVPPTLPPVVTEEGKGINIFCFGDSLTAGSVGNANHNYRPYSTYLEQELKKLQRKSKDDGIVKKVQVNSTGLPGRTSFELIHGSEKSPITLDQALGTFEDHGSSSLLDMVIILAGTNDILFQSFVDYNVSESVISMHRLALNQHNIPMTIALDLPKSVALEIADSASLEQVNMLSEGLESFAESEPRTTFVRFPFRHKKGDEEWWSKDRVHLSGRGYKRMAEMLAPIVQQILEEAGLW